MEYENKLYLSFIVLFLILTTILCIFACGIHLSITTRQQSYESNFHQESVRNTDTEFELKPIHRYKPIPVSRTSETRIISNPPVPQPSKLTSIRE